MPIPVPKRLERFASTPKRFKILIGGRGSAKSETVSAIHMAMVAKSGCTAVCCREFQSSIKQSVHSLNSRKIKELGLPGFTVLDTEIKHANGGLVIYQGLARDPQAIKSVDNAEICWVEEAQSLSEESIKDLTPSIRGAGSEIWMTANLGSSNDPFSKKFIRPFEKELRKNGYYEDDLHLIVWINYDDNPWFPIELERERLHDKQHLSQAQYDHKWKGEYADDIENGIIQASWFDACIDAHINLGFEPQGIEVISHDPSDTGNDAKGLAYRHGNVFLDIQENEFGDVNEGGDWAIAYALLRKPDVFIWDGDGMGIGLKRQFNNAFGGKNIRTEIFRGSATPDRPDEVYSFGAESQPRTNKETFKNARAQYYWLLRYKCRATWDAVTNGKYTDPEKLISFSSEIQGIDLLRSELCRIPLKPTTTGFLQIMSKVDMLKAKIPSPNMADSVMMSYAVDQIAAATRAPRRRLRRA